LTAQWGLPESRVQKKTDLRKRGEFKKKKGGMGRDRDGLCQKKFVCTGKKRDGKKVQKKGGVRKTDRDGCGKEGENSAVEKRLQGWPEKFWKFSCS